jgi:hypothetical protein
VGLSALAASSSAAALSSSVPVVRAAIHSVPVRPRAQAVRQDAGPCIPRALPPAALQADVPASASVPVAQVGDLALVPVPAVLLVPAADFCLQAKHRVRSVRVVRHAAVDASSTPRPRKAR